MNNFALFICGIAVTLMSSMGILVYMVSVGYEEKKRKPIEFDADLGATPTPNVVKQIAESDSIIGIHSVS